MSRLGRYERSGGMSVKGSHPMKRLRVMKKSSREVVSEERGQERISKKWYNSNR
jgi:hypothetical protein